jgi:hypothetical protein
MQPWQQAGSSRFQNPLVGSNAPQFGNRESDPGNALMPSDEEGQTNPMMMQYLFGRLFG